MVIARSFGLPTRDGAGTVEVPPAPHALPTPIAFPPSRAHPGRD